MQRALSTVLAVALLAVGTDALYSRNSAVQSVGAADLKKLEKGDTLILLELFAPWCGHCRNLVPEMEKVAKALKGIATVAAVDADEHKDLAQRFQVQGFPTILLLGTDRSKPIAYNGGRTAKDMAHFTLREAGKAVDARLGLKPSGGGKKKAGGPLGDSVDLTDDNFEETVLNSDDIWMVEFYAPWCGHCKNLAPQWAQAATELKGSGAKLGAVDATIHQAIASKYGIQGYPTIKVFSKGSVTDYEGQRSAEGIVSYAFGELEKHGKGIAVEEITTKEGLVEGCLERKSICVLAVLPHVMDTGAEGRNKYIETFTQAVKNVRSNTLAYGWITGGAQAALEEAFGIEYNYPTVVAINLQKQRFAVHKGSFSLQSIEKTLRGRAATSPIKNVNVFDKFEATEPWDGKDYVEPEEE
eukprot:TRINITY_DN467_c0_g1_i11.p1 TRINITY_DN467_c0_g1~~TRINITY_DN467_c0_g1_i11.p1  ORF type:complete len:413 (+),score=195.41 TRINITY_DN467_c0_g1_i11:60-1298(+)